MINNKKKSIKINIFYISHSFTMKSTKNSGIGSLWGELPARETLKQEVITPDIIENVWRQVMEESNNPDCDFQIDRQSEYIQ